MLVLLLFIDSFQFVLVFFFIRNIEKLEKHTLKLVLIVLHQLHQQSISHDFDSLSLKNFVNLVFNLIILKGFWINERQIVSHFDIIIIGLIKVACLPWENECDLLGTHPSA